MKIHITYSHESNIKYFIFLRSRWREINQHFFDININSYISSTVFYNRYKFDEEIRPSLFDHCDRFELCYIVVNHNIFDCIVVVVFDVNLGGGL